MAELVWVDGNNLNLLQSTEKPKRSIKKSRNAVGKSKEELALLRYKQGCDWPAAPCCICEDDTECIECNEFHYS